MPKYRVLQKSFINNALVEEGEVVDYDGDRGPNLELEVDIVLDAAAPARGKARKASEDSPLV